MFSRYAYGAGWNHLVQGDGPMLIIDDRTLETGLALWVQSATNGTRQRAYRSQMLIDDFP